MSTGLQDSAQQQLRRHIERIERLEEEKKALAADISDEFLAAKATGFDVKIMRQVLRLRRISKVERTEAQAILDTYLHALGMLDGTPLGKWAAEQEYAMTRHVAAAHGMAELGEEVIAQKRAKRAAENEPTISINGGPEHPMSVVREAVEIVKRSRGARA
jgi:uncharacterized protein (UPF0335 family)